MGSRDDRRITLSDSTPLDRQAEQIDRDIDNLLRTRPSTPM